MTDKPKQDGACGALGRRELLAYTAAFGAAFLSRQGLAADEPVAEETQENRLKPPPPRRCDMKK